MNRFCKEELRALERFCKERVAFTKIPMGMALLGFEKRHPSSYYWRAIRHGYHEPIPKRPIYPKYPYSLFTPGEDEFMVRLRKQKVRWVEMPCRMKELGFLPRHPNSYRNRYAKVKNDPKVGYDLENGA